VGRQRRARVRRGRQRQEFTITNEGAFALAERLAQRYWDMTREEHQKTVESWRAAAEGLRVLAMKPVRIRTSLG
jgi:hypothetical protein